jgi:cysteine synthase A
MARSGLRLLRAAQAASKPITRGYATSVTGLGREVEGFVGAVGHTPLVRPQQ